VLASKLRGLLAEAGVDGGKALTSAFGSYRLNLPDGTWVDTIAAADALRDAEAALAADNLDQAKAIAMEAASLARPSFLPGEDGTWVDGKRRELADILRRALSCLAEASLRSGDAAEAANWAEETIALEPYRETGYRQLMAAHAAAGNRAEALRVYERCRQLLATELGAYPSPETESNYRELLEEPSPESAPANAAANAAVEPEPARPRPTRQPNRIALGATAAILLLVTAAVAGLLATRGESSSDTAVAANAVGLIDAETGRVRDQVAVGTAPTSVAFGHGAVWVTNADANTVSRVDPENRSVRQTIPVGNSPSGIAVGAGAVWVANHDDDTVSWINPESNTVVREIRVGHGPTAVAFDDGSLWVTNSHDRTLSRIDAHTGKVAAPRINTGAVGRGIAVGAGSVWVTDEATRTVVQVDPGSNRVTSKTTVGAVPPPSSTAMGPYGSRTSSTAPSPRSTRGRWRLAL
jgi:SARP family transcriptional regulator, regulator of embCAB operon